MVQNIFGLLITLFVNTVQESGYSVHEPTNDIKLLITIIGAVTIAVLGLKKLMRLF